MTSETQRIAEIRAREQLAQSGPWTYHMDGQSESQLTAGENIYAVDYILSCCNVDDRTLQFIAHAREDVPWLLDALAASRAAEAALRAALEWYANPSSHVENDGGKRAREALAAAAAPAQGEGDE